MSLFGSGCGSHHYGEWTPTMDKEYKIRRTSATASKPYAVVTKHRRRCQHDGCRESETAAKPINGNRWKSPIDAKRELAGFLLGIDDADDLSRFVSDAANIDAEQDEYTRSALIQGRPMYPCACEKCECGLHSYDYDDACVWCEKGDHFDGERE